MENKSHDDNGCKQNLNVLKDLLLGENYTKDLYNFTNIFPSGSFAPPPVSRTRSYDATDVVNREHSQFYKSSSCSSSDLSDSDTDIDVVNYSSDDTGDESESYVPLIDSGNKQNRRENSPAYTEGKIYEKIRIGCSEEIYRGNQETTQSGIIPRAESFENCNVRVNVLDSQVVPLNLTVNTILDSQVTDRIAPEIRKEFFQECDRFRKLPESTESSETLLASSTSNASSKQKYDSERQLQEKQDTVETTGECLTSNTLSKQEQEAEKELQEPRGPYSRILQNFVCRYSSNNNSVPDSEVQEPNFSSLSSNRKDEFNGHAYQNNLFFSSKSQQYLFNTLKQPLHRSVEPQPHIFPCLQHQILEAPPYLPFRHQHPIVEISPYLYPPEQQRPPYFNPTVLQRCTCTQPSTAQQSHQPLLFDQPLQPYGTLQPRISTIAPFSTAQQSHQPLFFDQPLLPYGTQQPRISTIAPPSTAQQSHQPILFDQPLLPHDTQQSRISQQPLQVLLDLSNNMWSFQPSSGSKELPPPYSSISLPPKYSAISLSPKNSARSLPPPFSTISLSLPYSAISLPPTP